MKAYLKTFPKTTNVSPQKPPHTQPLWIIMLVHKNYHCGKSRAYSSEFNRLNHTEDLLLSRNRREVS
jgi:hypothetical protein